MDNEAMFPTPPSPTSPAHAGPWRRAAVAAIACAAVMLLGLASRRWPVAPQLLGKYPGDALWALMVFFGWTMLRPLASALRIALFAGTTCLAIEWLKLWQAPWLVEIRHTGAGHLVFGHAFSWKNMVAYALGILAGLICFPWLPRTEASHITSGRTGSEPTVHLHEIPPSTRRP